MELVDVRQALESGLIGSAMDLMTDSQRDDLRGALDGDGGGGGKR